MSNKRLALLIANKPDAQVIYARIQKLNNKDLRRLFRNVFIAYTEPEENWLKFKYTILSFLSLYERHNN